MISFASSDIACVFLGANVRQGNEILNLNVYLRTTQLKISAKSNGKVKSKQSS
jgi:hypothetical protein